MRILPLISIGAFLAVAATFVYPESASAQAASDPPTCYPTIFFGLPWCDVLARGGGHNAPAPVNVVAFNLANPPRPEEPEYPPICEYPGGWTPKPVETSLRAVSLTVDRNISSRGDSGGRGAMGSGPSGQNPR